MMSDSTLLIKVSRSRPCLGGCQSLFRTKSGYFSFGRVSTQSEKWDFSLRRLLKAKLSSISLPLS